MNGKRILIPIIIGFCFVFVSAVIFSISHFLVKNAQYMNYADLITYRGYRDVERLGYNLIFFASLFKIIGGLVLSVFTAAEAFFVEDKYIKLGLLVFSAITATTLFTVYSFSFPYY